MSEERTTRSRDTFSASDQRGLDYLEASAEFDDEAYWPSGAQFLAAMRKRVEPKFDGMKFVNAGGVIPTQTSGSYQRLGFYFRFRGDRMSLTVGEQNLNDISHTVPSPDFQVVEEDVTGDRWAGTLGINELVHHFVRLWSRLLDETDLPR